MNREIEDRVWSLCEEVKAGLLADHRSECHAKRRAAAAFQSVWRLSLHEADLIEAADGLAAVAAEDVRDYAERISPRWRDTIAQEGVFWAQKAVEKGLESEAFLAAYAVRTAFPAGLLPAPGRLLDMLS